MWNQKYKQKQIYYSFKVRPLCFSTIVRATQMHIFGSYPAGASTLQYTEPPPGFARPDQDDLNQGDRLFICFIGESSEDVKATQMISQRLAEAAEGTHMTHFEDIVPKPYHEFKDVFTKESFNKLPDWKQGDHAIRLVPDAQTFSTKVY